MLETLKENKTLCIPRRRWKNNITSKINIREVKCEGVD